MQSRRWDLYLNDMIESIERITRYTRDVQTPFEKDIELIVGSVRDLGLILP